MKKSRKEFIKTSAMLAAGGLLFPNVPVLNRKPELDQNIFGNEFSSGYGLSIFNEGGEDFLYITN